MSAFAARYARALADVVLAEHLDPTQVQSQLNDFAAAWRESPGLREIFQDPSFSAQRKVAILDLMNERIKMSTPARNFIAVLIDHDRIHAVEEVLAEFRHEMNVRLGISEVQVTTARNLDSGERQGLEAKIAAMTKTQVSATFQQDPSLLGGVILRVGSTVYDGSVRGRLSRLKEELAAS